MKSEDCDTIHRPHPRRETGLTVINVTSPGGKLSRLLPLTGDGAGPSGPKMKDASGVSLGSDTNTTSSVWCRADFEASPEAVEAVSGSGAG